MARNVLGIVMAIALVASLGGTARAGDADKVNDHVGHALEKFGKIVDDFSAELSGGISAEKAPKELADSVAAVREEEDDEIGKIQKIIDESDDAAVQSAGWSAIIEIQNKAQQTISSLNQRYDAWIGKVTPPPPATAPPPPPPSTVPQTTAAPTSTSSAPTTTSPPGTTAVTAPPTTTTAPAKSPTTTMSTTTTSTTVLAIASDGGNGPLFGVPAPVGEPSIVPPVPEFKIFSVLIPPALSLLLRAPLVLGRVLIEALLSTSTTVTFAALICSVMVSGVMLRDRRRDQAESR